MNEIECSLCRKILPKLDYKRSVLDGWNMYCDICEKEFVFCMKCTNNKTDANYHNSEHHFQVSII